MMIKIVFFSSNISLEDANQLVENMVDMKPPQAWPQMALITLSKRLSTN